MKFAITPRSTFSYVLSDYRDKPRDQWRMLKCRFLSADAAMRLRQDLAESDDQPTNRERLDRLVSLLRPLLVGWTGFGDVPAIRSARIDTVLTAADLEEIRQQITYEMKPGHAEKTALRLVVGMYYGKICRCDGNGKCVENCPTSDSPITIDCPTCDDRGCDRCKDIGTIDVTSCARRLVPASAWEMLQWVLRAEDKGILPMPGGGLSQTNSFLDCWDFISAEMIRWKTPS